MGQRTQIIYQKLAKNGNAITKVYHLQWGFGKQMPTHFMRLVADDYLKARNYNKPYNFLDEDVIPLHFPEWNDLTKWFESRPQKIQEYLNKEDITEEERKEYLGYLNNANNLLSTLQNLDITNIDQVAHIFKYCDNNNGGMLIQAIEGNYEYDRASFKIGFVLGNEETLTLFTQFVTAEEYLKRFEPYSDKDFRKMFKDFCNYYGVKEIAE